MQARSTAQAQPEHDRNDHRRLDGLVAVPRRHETPARTTIDGVDQAVAAIDASTNLAAASGRTLADIVELIERASKQVQAIAEASRKEAAEGEEIDQAVRELAAISQETAEAMGQASRAVGELAGQAGSLRALIEKMKDA